MTKPYFIFEITPECDFDCIYCYNVWKANSDYQQKTLSAEKIKELFNKILQNTDIEGVTITGGEPLLYPELLDVAKFFKSKNIKLGITTHGALLDEAKTKELIDAGFSYFEISLDAVNPEIHEKLTKNNQLDKIKKTILNIKKYGGLLTISTIISKINLDEIPNVIDLSFAFSADFISLNRFIPGGQGLKNISELSPGSEDLKKVLEIANQKAEKYKFNINISVPVEDCIIPHKNYPNLNFGTCLCGEKKWLIDSVGNLRTCEQNPEILGNLFETSFPDLYNSESAQKFRLNNLKINCKTCKSYFSCGGACRFIR
ncbi:MAG: radical SAM protein [Bacteroidales bacterium]|nr:radical SAM protein [Bacteroidales bacterium]